MWHNLSIVEAILRNRQDFFAEIREGIGLREKILAMAFSSTVFLAIYGGVMGAASKTDPLLQMGSSAFKLPILFLITLIICVPSLYFFNLLFGSRQTLGQNIALIMTAVTTTAVLLVSFAPVSLFFLSTAGGYDFIKLLNVGVFAISGMMGVYFLRQGFGASVDAENPEGRGARRSLFIAWVILYAFVGMQMAWTLRPFIGAPNRSFEIVRQSTNSNFYENVLKSAGDFIEGE
ncbi:MAG: actin-binding WH2 domain-containing protein [Armatimonadetes bacterium]|nr:actin-binding WH2 domain-containing protein [Anaerolineae bacterium]